MNKGNTQKAKAQPSLSQLPIDQVQTIINYRFNDQELLGLALRHRSVGKTNNERMEFFGDAVLGCVIAHEIYDLYPGAQEGELTEMRKKLVNNKSLALLAKRINLHHYIVIGESKPKKSADIQADTLEAIFGSVFLDGGWQAAKTVILKIYGDNLEHVQVVGFEKNAKSRLQELLQAKGLPLPEYELINETGKPHERQFEFQCQADGKITLGVGNTKKSAEQVAAQKMLARMGLIV